jgi:hypothetical protein
MSTLKYILLIFKFQDLRAKESPLRSYIASPNSSSPEKNLIVNMVVHISCEATAIEGSYQKRSLPTIRPAMC